MKVKKGYLREIIRENILIPLITLLMVGCGGIHDSGPRNAELTVEYMGKRVHHVGAAWTTQREVQVALDKPGKKYILFGAPWCNLCKRLKRLLKQENIHRSVLNLNIDEIWAFNLSRNLGATQVPALVVIDQTTILNPRYGPNNILVYLLVNIK